VLQREAALRNLLGLPPYAPDRLTPTTPPTNEQLEFDWNALVTMAETYRPDLIELKLVLEADQQLLIQARNQTGPRVDALALYRWNGLDGTMPIGDPVASRLGEGTDWTLGVNFSVPLGLRQARAQLRQTELLIARDRANLEQGVHAAVHDVALSLRNLAQFYAQYQAYQETRSAARDNLEQQMERYRAQLVQYLNVLQAITDWGNAVSAEAQALAQYNIELAQLSVQTGSILETHGIYFFEERFAALAPLSCLGRTTCYPEALPPTENESQYPAGDEPSEEFFDLEDPMANARRRRLDLKDLPPLPDPMIPSVPLQQPDSALPAPLPPPLPPE
jgi:outer membrane protein TolC